MVVTATFGAIAKEYLAKLEAEQRAEATLEKVTWLLGFALQKLGHLPIAEISVSQIWEVLEAMQKRGRIHSAHRLRALIGAVFRYGVATGRAPSDPTSVLRGSLVAQRRTHRAAIVTPDGLGALLRSIDAFDGQPTTSAALKLMAILFPRPGELRAAQWEEVNRTESVWTVPPSRMKMRRQHRVPLPRQAIEILDQLHAITGHGPFLFPSLRTQERPISENTLNATLRRLGYSKDEMTSHGFRASASTLLNESGKWHPDAIERQLSHIEPNEVRRAYTRGEHWDERLKMMQWWADYLDRLRATPHQLPKPQSGQGSWTPREALLLGYGVFLDDESEKAIGAIRRMDRESLLVSSDLVGEFVVDTHAVKEVQDHDRRVVLYCQRVGRDVRLRIGHAHDLQ
jgi:integrase